jgi:hypothetical protein
MNSFERGPAQASGPLLLAFIKSLKLTSAEPTIRKPLLLRATSNIESRKTNQAPTVLNRRRQPQPTDHFFAKQSATRNSLHQILHNGHRAV